MSDNTAMGIGLMIAIFGPLLLVPLIWAMARWPLRWLIGNWTERHFGQQSGLARLGISAILMVAVVLATYLPGRTEFSRLCEAHAEPVVNEVVDVPGFYATELFPYQADKFLREWGFAYIEAPDMYKKGRTLRYAVAADGKTVATEIAAPTSRYAVSNTFRQLGNSITLNEKRVFELATGHELAHAGKVNFHGGPLFWLLGVYGMSDCPNPRYQEGRRQFDDFYYLERKVLRSASSTTPIM